MWRLSTKTGGPKLELFGTWFPDTFIHFIEQGPEGEGKQVEKRGDENESSIGLGHKKAPPRKPGSD